MMMDQVVRRNGGDGGLEDGWTLKQGLDYLVDSSGWVYPDIARAYVRKNCESCINGQPCPACIDGQEIVDQKPALGCTSDAASNYDPAATRDDGSCILVSAASAAAAVLLAFLASGNGISIAATWLAGTDPCAGWAGVTCDPAGATVTELDLYGRNTPFAGLTGDVGLLGGLRGLAYLNLRYTGVTGDVGLLGGCTGLAYLNLGDTAVTGNVGGLGACTGLAYLQLYDTGITGDVGALGACTGLAFLSLGATAVTGDVGGLRGLAALRLLSLGSTGATGWPLAIPSGCTFADEHDYYGGHTWDEYSSAYDVLTSRRLRRPDVDGGVGYTC